MTGVGEMVYEYEYVNIFCTVAGTEPGPIPLHLLQPVTGVVFVRIFRFFLGQCTKCSLCCYTCFHLQKL